MVETALSATSLDLISAMQQEEEVAAWLLGAAGVVGAIWAIIIQS
jgi:hypothetical protein